MLVSTYSDIAKHPHHIAVLAYLEMTTRFSAIFKYHADFLPRVLLTMMGTGCVTTLDLCITEFMEFI